MTIQTDNFSLLTHEACCASCPNSEDDNAQPQGRPVCESVSSDLSDDSPN